jgi:hypothetical protein
MVEVRKIGPGLALFIGECLITPHPHPRPQGRGEEGRIRFVWAIFAHTNLILPVSPERE